MLNTIILKGKNMNDDSVMPFGKYKGKLLLDVPASYLLWWADQSPETYPELLEFVLKNKKHLEDEANAKKERNNE